MALPALRAARLKHPGAQIAVLARPYVADIYREQKICDELIPYDWTARHAGIAGRERLASELRERKFDVALLLQNAFDAAWLAWRAGIPQRIGYGRDGRSWLLTKAVPVPRPAEIPAHEKFYYLELLRRAGWTESLEDNSFIGLEVPEPLRKRAEETLLSFGARPDTLRIAIGAGASYGSAKCWPPERFAEVANRLSVEKDAEIILFGTTGEIPVAQAIIAAMRRKAINLTGKTNIADLPALLSRCHVFIGNDSGGMHVAAAVGLPVVAIFGPTDPFGTSPVTLKKAIVRQKPYCSPCFLRRCPIDHRCMTVITPAMVHEALVPLLNSVEVPSA
jgi:heptosyltransferase-2